MSTATPRRYHHGELRAALLDEGVDLARAGGPEAVQLRDAARRAGVSHNAGYRHFADRQDYLDSVAARGMSELAAAMEVALAEVPDELPPQPRAMVRLSVVGRAYLDFALAQTGLFRTAFATSRQPEAVSTDPTSRGPGGLDPYELLVAAMDELADAGLIPAERRGDSEIVAWSAVHGLAVLLVDGPLRGSPPEAVDAMWERCCAAVLRGL